MVSLYSAPYNKSHRSIHSLVALAYLPPKPHPSYEVNHKDGNKLNNHIKNLEWVTSSGNKIHAHDLGLSKHYGENHEYAKLTEKDVILIRKLAKGDNDTALGLLFGVHRRTINDVRRGKTWRCVTT